jgi:glycosyltransferase involved in cell wall biosynthesis
MMTQRTILFISKSEVAASTRYRGLNYFPYLKKAGWHCEHIGIEKTTSVAEKLLLLRKASQADVVVVLRKTFTAAFIFLLRLFSKRMVFDFDDAVLTSSNDKLSFTRMKRFAKMAKACDAIWAGNEYLATHARLFNTSVTVLPTSIEPEKYNISAPKPDNYFDLVWIGSSSTKKYLVDVIPILEQAAKTIPHLRLKIIADFTLYSDKLNIYPVQWQSLTEAMDLASSHAGIAPMPDDPWTKGKCGLKVIQYMAAGLPVISSPSGVNKDIVMHGTTGFLAANSEQWIEALMRLSADANLRTTMGSQGKAYIEKTYSTKHSFQIMKTCLETLVSGKP